jgi:uncharacterized protein YodC (DUF2158 family)
MSKQKRKPQAPPKFVVGDHVRVKHGIKDANYPDVPLGGWAGTISEIHDDGMYTICWSKETLDSIHPIYRKRCERDGIELEKYWIGSDDLEPDPGGRLNIEQPKKITTKPLSPKDQDDRIRIVFGLTSNDPLPDVDDETLLTYHQYLAENLLFPFYAEHGSEYGHPERVKVLGLGDPDDEPMIDEMYGILCDVRIEGQVVNLPLGELDVPSRNRQLLRDYCYWFWNWQ